jgi:hypothetical protein
MTDTRYEWMAARALRGVKDLHGAVTRCDHGIVGKSDPLPFILPADGLASYPIRLLVSLPVGMNPHRDFWR